MLQEDDLALDVHWLPFQLDPNTPAEGVSLVEHLGMTPENLETTFQYLKQRADELGLAINPPTLKVNTKMAHLLAEYARPLGSFDALRKELFAAYFVRGENLADETVLKRIVDDVGLDWDDALRSIEAGVYDETMEMAQKTAMRAGIRGVPAFIIADRYLISGAQPYEHMVEAMRTIQKELQAPSQ